MTSSTTHAGPRGRIRAAAEAPAALPSVCRRRRGQPAAGTLQHRRVPGKARLHVLGENHGDGEVVARDEAQLVERTRIFLAVGAVLRRAVVVEELLDRAEVAQGVPRVHGAEFLLREQPTVARIGVDRAERVAGKRVAVLERSWCGVANGSQELEERGVLPREYLQLIRDRKRPILKLGHPVK